MHAQEGELEDPKDQKSDHPIGRDTLRRRDIIVKIQVARPNSPDHNTDRVPTIHILDGKPEHGENDSGNDGDIRTPEPPASAGDHGEWDMVDGADGTVGRNNKGYNEEGDGDDGNGLAVG
jgi:hypothetical protein